MSEWIVHLDWDDNEVGALIIAESEAEAEANAIAEYGAPDGTAVSVRPFVPVRTVEADGTVTIRDGYAQAE